MKWLFYTHDFQNNTEAENLCLYIASEIYPTFRVPQTYFYPNSYYTHIDYNQGLNCGQPRTTMLQPFPHIQFSTARLAEGEHRGMRRNSDCILSKTIC